MKPNDYKIIEGVYDDKTNKTIKNLFKFKKSKNKKSQNPAYIYNIRVIKKLKFLFFSAKKTFY